MVDRVPSQGAVAGIAVQREPADEILLDNPIWNALRTRHAGLALGHDLSRRYPSFIGPLSGIPAPAAENYHALGALAPYDIVVLFSVLPIVPPGSWTVLRTLDIAQMIRRAPPPFAPQLARPGPGVEMRRLSAADAPAMLELAQLTEPGPFRLRTLELGGFYGIFQADRLLAMSGRRMHLPGFVEVSAVCTHPHARGRGYAQMLMSRVIDEIEQEGLTPFLHAVPGNPAIRIYERLGFAERRRFHCAVLKPNDA